MLFKKKPGKDHADFSKKGIRFYLFTVYTLWLAFFFLCFLNSHAKSFSSSSLSVSVSLSQEDSISSNYIYHRVESKETLYGISKKYNIGLQTLLQENPDIIDGLKSGQLLRIPRIQEPDKKANERKEEIHPAVKTGSHENTKNTEDTEEGKSYIEKETHFPTAHHTRSTDTLKVAVFLPLHLESAIESEDTTDIAATSVNDLSLPALEFYEGLWLAADSVKKLGHSVHLSVYDTRNDTAHIKELMKKPELASTELVIGPMQSSDLPPILKFSGEKKMMLAIPFSVSHSLLGTNPNISTTSASVRTQCEEMGEYLVRTFPKDEFIFVSTGSSRETELISNFKNKIHSQKVKAELVYPKQGLDSLKKHLSHKGKNIIVVCSSDESAVNNLLSNLHSLKDTSIVVIGMPTWENFQSLEYTILQSLNVHFFTTTHLDFSGTKTKNFFRLFRSVYKTDPSIYACQGFDIGFYYLNMLAGSGKTMNEHLPDCDYDGIHTRFVFKKDGENGGCENSYISVLKYEDFLLKKVNH